MSHNALPLYIYIYIYIYLMWPKLIGGGDVAVRCMGVVVVYVQAWGSQERRTDEGEQKTC
jgi:hypothetical protein